MSTSRARRALLPTLALAVFCVGPASWLPFGCSRQPDLDEVFEPPRQNEPSRRSPPARAVFELAPGSRVDFWLGPRPRELHGSLAVAHSRLLIDPAQPSATRGSVTFDLASVSIDPGGENSWRRDGSARPDPEPSLTEQSLRWLEVSPATALAAHPELRFAQFLIRDASAASGSSSRPARAPGDPEPAGPPSAWTISGELELHGIRAPYNVPLSVSFSFSPATPGSPDPPPRLDIVTREPARLSLTAHGLVPRDEHGDILAELLAELRKSRIDEVRLGARWTATRVGAEGAVAAP